MRGSEKEAYIVISVCVTTNSTSNSHTMTTEGRMQQTVQGVSDPEGSITRLRRLGYSGNVKGESALAANSLTILLRIAQT